MDESQAAAAFAALGQPVRIAVLRLLLHAGETGMRAGDIAEKLGVRQNTMSANLGVLLNAGLIRNRRDGRSIRYFADLQGVRGLLGFLMQECCGGHPELCQPVIAELASET